MPDDVRVSSIVMGALLILGAIAFAVVVAFLAIGADGEDQGLSRTAAGLRDAPDIAGSVKLDPSPAIDIAAFRAEKRRRLETYGWIDREHGIARIPIDRAMALLTQRQPQEAKR
jgi:hypothetical protein